jgi:hypothetical protein
VLNAEEIASAKSELPEAVFKELYLAEAADDEGNPFGQAAIEACIGELSKREPKWWGWDLAKRSEVIVAQPHSADSGAAALCPAVT